MTDVQVEWVDCEQLAEKSSSGIYRESSWRKIDMTEASVEELLLADDP
jgi:hypothetical protein